jgi:hypothetical protein
MILANAGNRRRIVCDCGQASFKKCYDLNNNNPLIDMGMLNAESEKMKFCSIVFNEDTDGNDLNYIRFGLRLR